MIHTKISEELQRSQSYEVPAESSAQLTKQLSELVIQYVKLDSETNSDLAKYNAFNSKDVTEVYNALKWLHTSYYDRNAGYESTKAKIPAQLNIDVAETYLKEYKEIYARASTNRDKLVPIISEKRTARALREQYIKSNNERTTLINRLGELTTKLNELVEPIAPITTVDISELKMLINDTRRDYQNATSFVSRFRPNSNEVPQCPTCSTFAIVTINNELAPLSSKVAEYEQQSIRLKSELSEAIALWEKLDLEKSNYEKSKLTFAYAKSNLLNSIESTKRQIEDRPLIEINPDQGDLTAI